MSTGALVCGAAAGGGLAVAVAALLPARPDLGAVLQRVGNTEPVAAAGGLAGGSLPWAEQLGGRLLERAGAWLTVPRRELDLLGVPAARHLGNKVCGAVAGLGIPQVFTALLAWSGTPLGLQVSLVVSLLFAAVIWFGTDQDVRARAAAARREFRFAVASFMERARLERAASAGAESALYRAAAVGDGWVFARIRAALEHARLAGIAPWDALKTLADQLDVPELARPAEAFSLAGGEGVSIQAALASQSRALRARLLTDMQAEANAASEKSVVPGTVVFMALFCVIGYPAIQALMAT